MLKERRVNWCCICVTCPNSFQRKELRSNISFYTQVLFSCHDQMFHWTNGPSIFIENISEYKEALQDADIVLTQGTKIGITAGASTLKQELIDLKALIEKDYNS